MFSAGGNQRGASAAAAAPAAAAPAAAASVDLPIVGRERELNLLKSYVSPELSGIALVSLMGVAGMGKSYCAKRFVSDWKKENPTHRKVLWIDCTYQESVQRTMRQATPTTTTAADAPTIKPPPPPQARSPLDINNMQDARIKAFWEYLLDKEKKQWIVVFDSVPETKSPVEFWTNWIKVPKKHSRWNLHKGNKGDCMILLTSRSPLYQGHQFEKRSFDAIRLQRLNGLDAPRLLSYEIYKSKGVPEREARRLLDAPHAEPLHTELASHLLGGLPFAIVLSAIHLAATAPTGTTKDHMASLRNGFDDAALRFLAGIKSQLRGTLATLTLLAKTPLLSVLAFLAPDRIPVGLLFAARGGNNNYGGGGGGHLKQNLEVLQTVGLIWSSTDAKTPEKQNNHNHHHAERHTFSISCVHQSVLKSIATPAHAVELLNACAKAVDDGIDQKDMNFGASLLPHVIATIDNIEAAQPKPTSWLKSLDMHAFVHLVLKVGRFFHYGRQDYPQAWKYYRKGLLYQRRLHGEDARSPQIASTMESIAILKHDEGKPREAIQWMEEVLNAQRRIYGPATKNLAVAGSLHNMALLYHDEGSYSQARKLLEEALEIETKLFGANASSPTRALTIFNLAQVCRAEKDYAQSRKLLSQIVRVNGHDWNGDSVKSVRVALILRGQGDLASDEGRLPEALHLLQLSLRILRDVYGQQAKNKDIANALQSLAIACSRSGNIQRARDLALESLAMLRSVHGRQTRNSDIVDSLRQCASLLLVGERNPVLALRLLDEAFEALKDIHGHSSRHPSIVDVLKTLDKVYEQEGHYSSAQKLQDGLLEVEGSSTPTAPERVVKQPFVRALLRALRTRALHLWMSGSYGEAKKSLSDILKTTDRIQNSQLDLRQERFEAIYLMAMVNKEQGNISETIRYFGHALVAVKALEGNSGGKLLFEATVVMAELHSGEGNIPLAHGFFNEAMAVVRRMFGSVNVASSLEQTLARLQKVYRDVANIVLDGFNYGHPFFGLPCHHSELLACLERLVQISHRVSRLPDTRALYCKILVLKLHIYGINAQQEEVVETLHSLGSLTLREGKSREARLFHGRALNMVIFYSGQNKKGKELALSHILMGCALFYEPTRDTKRRSEALAHFVSAEGMLRQLSDGTKDNMMAQLLLHRGNFHRDDKEYDKANICYEQAIETLPTPKDPCELQANLLCEMGVLGYFQGELQEASVCLSEAIECFTTIYGREGMSVNWAVSLLALGLVNIRLENSEKPRSYMAHGLTMASRLEANGNVLLKNLVTFKNDALAQLAKGK